MFDSFIDCMKNCHIVKLNAYARENAISAEIYAYLEFGGITASYTDAVCDGMLAICRERGELMAGGAVIEACSGTFSISLAAACARQGHPLFLVMPAETPLARLDAIRALGAKISLCAGTFSALKQRAIGAAAELSAYYLNYMENDANCEYHRRITGPTIMRECGEIQAVIAGVGSGGTITGIGESIKAWQPDCKIIAVEPYESRAISGGIIGRHAITGIGFGFVPENYNSYIVDKVMAVTSQSAVQAAKDLQLYEGLPACAACGAAVCAAKTLTEIAPEIKRITCIFPSRSGTEI